MSTGAHKATAEREMTSEGVKRVTADLTLGIADQHVEITGGAATVTVTMPNPIEAKDREYYIELTTLGATAADLAFPSGINSPGGYIFAAVGDWVRIASDGDRYIFVGSKNAPRVHKIALAAVDTAGGLFSWQNPETVAVMASVSIDLTTVSSGAGTADIGPAADATTLNDTLLDGLDLNAAVRVFNGFKDLGTNGLGEVKVAENGGAADFITGSVASGASAGIVGFAYVTYRIP